MSTASRIQNGDIDAAFREAVALHRSGDFSAAAQRYEALRVTAPDNAELLYLLGTAYVQLDRPRDALAPLERSLTVRPGNGPALEMMGSALHRAGDPEAAVSYFVQALAVRPLADTAFNLGNALSGAARHGEAADAFKQALAIEPQHARAGAGLGIALTHLGRTAEAEAVLRESLRHNPAHASTYVTLGTLLGQGGRFADAEQVFRAGLAAGPNNAGLARLLANSLHRQGRLDDAAAAYRDVLALTPRDVLALTQIGDVLTDLGRIDEAEDFLRTAVAEDPNAPGPLTGLGRVQEMRGALDDAIVLHNRAIAADPQHENAYISRGNARRFSGDFDGALMDYNAALALKSGLPAAVANRGMTLLTLGRLSEGWPDYKLRIRARAGSPDLTHGKPWDGGPLTGKKILVWTEYGLGDEIMFASLLPELIAQVRHCTIVCSARLVALFSRSFPTATAIPHGAATDDNFDVRVPLTDIAHVLRPALSSFPSHGGYLKPDAAMTAMLRRRYATAPGRRIVGVSWRSGAAGTGGFKSAPLAAWAPILRAPNTTFVSLQYGDCARELNDARRLHDIDIFSDPEIDASGDMDTFAAQVAAMDLIVSVSNTTVHFAGALGKPVWVLVPKGSGAHWYWFLNRTDNPWYPSARIFRQSARGAWDAPLAAVADELKMWGGPA